MDQETINERDKLKRLMLYIAWKEQSDPRFGETKFNKLLFFSNAYCFGDTGRPILQHFKFQREKLGPTLKAFTILRDELEASGEAFIQRREFHNRSQKRLIPVGRPDISDFTAEEIAVIDEVIARFWEKNGTDMSDFSHELPAWKALPNGTIMHPASVFVTHRDLTEDEADYAATLTPSLSDAAYV